MANVAGFIKYIVDNIRALDPSNKTADLLEKKFKSMSKEEIHAFYLALKAEKRYVPYYVPNSSDQKFEPERWIKLSEKLGLQTFIELVREDPVTHQMTVTDIKYWVALLPARRHLHYLEAKRSIPRDNKTRDILTGQVTGDSKGSSFSKPQLGGLIQRNCIANAVELYKYRGGDISGGREFNKQLVQNGGTSLSKLLQTKTEPTVKKTLSAHLNGMHLQHQI